MPTGILGVSEPASYTLLGIESRFQITPMRKGHLYILIIGNPFCPGYDRLVRWRES